MARAQPFAMIIGMRQNAGATIPNVARQRVSAFGDARIARRFRRGRLLTAATRLGASWRKATFPIRFGALTVAGAGLWSVATFRPKRKLLNHDPT
jgi:hypothetical protein